MRIETRAAKGADLRERVARMVLTAETPYDEQWLAALDTALESGMAGFSFAPAQEVTILLTPTKW